uniref:Putative methyltransferase n=1 Tax=viral metagenome TaxID=1070528 RepID=A0A6M3IVL0_9ZZZZ
MPNKYYGQWNPRADEVLHENYFKAIRNGFFVDCGAGDGVIDSNTKFFEDSLDWTGVCIEPSPVSFNQLTNRRPNTKNLMLGLSDHDGTITFTEAVNSSNFSGGAVKYHPRLKAFVSACGYNFKDITIETMRYDTLLVRLSIIKVNLLSIDVEGYEASVIAGMSGATILPDVICIEYTCVGIQRAKRLLAELGYRFDFVSFNNAYFSRGLPIKEWFGTTDIMGCFEDE